MDQKLKAYVSASGHRPSPSPGTQLSVGLTVGYFAAMDSTCQGTERITLMSSMMSAVFPFLYGSFETRRDGDIKQHQPS